MGQASGGALFSRLRSEGLLFFEWGWTALRATARAPQPWGASAAPWVFRKTQWEADAVEVCVAKHNGMPRTTALLALEY